MSTVAGVNDIGNTDKLKVGVIYASVFLERLNIIWSSKNTHH